MSRRMNNDHYNIVHPDEFDNVFRREAIIADLRTKKDEELYEKKDRKLINRIKETVLTQFQSLNEDKIYILEDWWPDHTRHMEVSVSRCTSGFLSSLQALLAGDYSNYRIQLAVYHDISEGTSYIGSVVLYSNRRLIEQPLYAALVHN